MNLLAFGPFTWEWIPIAIVALLIFGRRLPMVARNLGASINQFKFGLRQGKKGENDDNQILLDEDQEKKALSSKDESTT